MQLTVSSNKYRYPHIQDLWRILPPVLVLEISKNVQFKRFWSVFWNQVTCLTCLVTTTAGSHHPPSCNFHPIWKKCASSAWAKIFGCRRELTLSISIIRHTLTLMDIVLTLQSQMECTLCKKLIKTAYDLGFDFPIASRRISPEFEQMVCCYCILICGGCTCAAFSAPR